MYDRTFIYKDDLRQRNYFILGDGKNTYHIGSNHFETLPQKGDKIRYIQEYNGDYSRCWVNDVEIELKQIK